MILVITALRALMLHRVPKGTFMVLWGAALARLPIPFSLPSALSVYTLLAGKEAPALQNAALAAVLPEEAAAASQQAGAASGGAISVWAAVWAVGTVLCAAYFALGYARRYREFQTSLPVENEFARRWLQTHRLRRQISVRQLDCVSSALTFGVLQPGLKRSSWASEHLTPPVTRRSGLPAMRKKTAISGTGKPSGSSMTPKDRRVLRTFTPEQSTWRPNTTKTDSWPASKNARRMRMTRTRSAMRRPQPTIFRATRLRPETAKRRQRS